MVKCNDRISQLLYVAVITQVFVVYWILGQLNTYFQNTIQSHETSSVMIQESNEAHITNDNQQEQQQQQQTQLLQNHESLWFGWQPSITSNVDCSWRQCFNISHGCNTTCRDEDLGEAPQPIKPVPPSNATAHDSAKYWIPDVTMLHRMLITGTDADGNIWPPPLSNELCESIGGQNDGNKKLFDAVPITVVVDSPSSSSYFSATPNNYTYNNQSYPNNNDLSKKSPKSQQPVVSERGPTILCMIYTMKDAHYTRVRAIRETWASRCDGFLAFSTKSDPRIPAISIEHDGPESYQNMWQKVRSIWKFVGTYYNTQFDYYMLGGDDLFVIPENLRHYLSTNYQKPTTNHHFIGRRFRSLKKHKPLFYSGGPGYVFSQATLNSLISVLDHPKCSPSELTSAEDIMLSRCLHDVLNISFIDTRDEQSRERFHHLSPSQVYRWEPGRFPKWYGRVNQNWGIRLGKDCCAPDSISFHWIKKPAMLRYLYSLIYTCKNKR